MPPVHVTRAEFKAYWYNRRRRRRRGASDDTPPAEEDPSLDFSNADNSQYIALLMEDT